MKLEKYEDAKAISQAVLDVRQIPWAMCIIGQVLMQQKKTEEAEEQFRKIIDEDINFMPAYDWLAKLLNQSKKYTDAQSILVEAVKISPKSVLRQRNLADTAEKNNDLVQLEKSRKKVVEVGKSSCLKKSKDYTSLAAVYLKNNSAEKAVDVLKQTKRSFRNDKQVMLDSSIQLSSAYHKLNDKENQITSVNNSLKLAEDDTLNLRGENALALARSCMELGKTDAGEKILSSVVKEYFEDENIMQSISDIFSDAGIETAGEELIAKARAEVVALNNKGVKLISAGKTNDAIELFKMAVSDLPGNITVNLNIASALLIDMQKNGIDKDEQKNVEKYLDVILSKNENHTKALDIQRQVQAL